MYPHYNSPPPPSSSFKWAHCLVATTPILVLALLLLYALGHLFVQHPFETVFTIAIGMIALAVFLEVHARNWKDGRYAAGAT